MESTQAPVTIRHVIHTTVFDVKEGISKAGKGWWVQFEGSRESLWFDDPQPFEVGDKVKITFQKE